MNHPSPDLVAADLAKLIYPGLRSPRTSLVVLPAMAVVEAAAARGALSAADASALRWRYVRAPNGSNLKLEELPQPRLWACYQVMAGGFTMKRGCCVIWPTSSAP